MAGLHEECGVFGIYSKETRDLANLTYYGLFALQHRGQESAGIVVNDEGVFKVRKGMGLVNDVFSPEDLTRVGPGNISVGHVRYATTGADDINNIQPIVANHNKGKIALAHNGNLTNSYELRCELEEKGAIFHTTTDSEVIVYLIVQERLKTGSIEKAVGKAMERIEGAYSLVISSPQKLIAARDPYGFRPLCYGVTEDGMIVFASESCALDAVNARFVRDLLPGEIAIVDAEGIRFDTTHCQTKPRRMCVFEYIYFARPDSTLDGASVSQARQRAGAFLAKEHPVEADIVIGVPDSGLEAALGYSRESGIPYAIGFTKNKYIGRTFIAPSQDLREQGVNIKLNPIRSVVEGKRVVMVDDSIVRGTTCRRIISQLWKAGAKEVHMMVSAPPFTAPCFYGTDVDQSKGLIANQMTIEQIREQIGATSLGYLSYEHVTQLTGEDTGFCTACFGGEYPTKITENVGKLRFEDKIIPKDRSGAGK
ncbi:MAG: amidophosphoribosyltransferase [Lachnospiraceae bacterium]|nr:amidophosphoribosyltransferase [Lachnospiraceae bacterium]